MATLLKVFQQEFDNSGNPNVGGTITVYNHDTLDLADIYSAVDGETPIQNPVTLGGSGRVNIYVGSGIYDAVLKDSLGNTLAQSVGISGGLSGSTSDQTFYNTIAELQGASAGVSSIANVTGYYTAGDGKAFKQYKWDADSTDSDNSGAVIQPLSAPASGRWLAVVGDMINPFQFGAKGDGSTNDYAAFLSANNYCASFTNKKTMYIKAPSSKYVLGTAITFTCPVVIEKNVTLKTTDLNVTFSDNVKLSGANFELGTGTVTIGAGLNATGPVFTGVAGVTFTDPTIIDSDWFTSSQFKVMVDSAGANACQIIIDKDFTLTANTTVPSNVYLNFVSGVIDCSTYQLTINSFVEAGNRKIFDGWVNLGNRQTVNIRWFGATGVLGANTQTSDEMTANVKALGHAMKTLDNGILYIPGRNVQYHINKTIVPGGYTLATALTGVTTSVVVSQAILKGTPQTGTLYLYTNDWSQKNVNYTSWSGSTFTIVSTDFTDVVGPPAIINSCAVGNRLYDVTGSTWLLKGEDSMFTWAGSGATSVERIMFQVSSDAHTFPDIENVWFRGWYTFPNVGQGAHVGLDYGKTRVGHFHYRFNKCEFSRFRYDDASTAIAQHPNGGGTNGGNDFEYYNCYWTENENCVTIGLPDQHFSSCTFTVSNKNAVRFASNARATFTRCYLSPAEYALVVGSGMVGAYFTGCWFEGTGTLVGYVEPGTACDILSGLNFTGCRFAQTCLQDLTLATSLTGVTTSVVVSETIPTTTPQTGNLSITRNSGAILTVAYTSWTGSTFTIGSTDFTATPCTSGNLVQAPLYEYAFDFSDIKGNVNITSGDLASAIANAKFRLLYTNELKLGINNLRNNSGEDFTLWTDKTFTLGLTLTGTMDKIFVNEEIDLATTPATGIVRYLTDGNTPKAIAYTGRTKQAFPLLDYFSVASQTFELTSANRSISVDGDADSELKGFAGIHIVEGGRTAQGIYALEPYNSIKNGMTFERTVDASGIADGADGDVTISDLTGLNATSTRNIVTVLAPDNSGYWLNGRVSGTDTMVLSIHNRSGGAGSGTLKVWIKVEEHDATRILAG